MSMVFLNKKTPEENSRVCIYDVGLLLLQIYHLEGVAEICSRHPTEVYACAYLLPVSVPTIPDRVHPPCWLRHFRMGVNQTTGNVINIQGYICCDW